MGPGGNARFYYFGGYMNDIRGPGAFGFLVVLAVLGMTGEGAAPKRSAPARNDLPGAGGGAVATAPASPAVPVKYDEPDACEGVTLAPPVVWSAEDRAAIERVKTAQSRALDSTVARAAAEKETNAELLARNGAGEPTGQRDYLDGVEKRYCANDGASWKVDNQYYIHECAILRGQQEALDPASPFDGVFDWLRGKESDTPYVRSERKKLEDLYKADMEAKARLEERMGQVAEQAQAAEAQSRCAAQKARTRENNCTRQATYQGQIDRSCGGAVIGPALVQCKSAEKSLAAQKAYEAALPENERCGG